LLDDAGFLKEIVERVLQELLEAEMTELSSLAESLEAELEGWRSHRLEATSYPYLFVDARYEKVRVDHRVVSQGVLIVSGVREDGFREIVAVEVADTESEATNQELFRFLKSRVLSSVELVV
jgi:putative transposase